MTINERIAEGARHIVLSQDTDEQVTVPAGATLTLDLAGFALRGDGTEHTVLNNGILRIIDSSSDLTGTIYGNVKNKACIFNNFGGQLLIKNATLTRGDVSYYCLLNWGALVTIDHVKIVASGNAAAISNGFYSPSKDNPNKAFVKMVIRGADISTSGSPNACVKNDEYGIMAISGGKFVSQTQYAVNSWNELSITGGHFESVAAKPLVCGSTPGDGGKCVLKIMGGEFRGATGIIDDCSEKQTDPAYTAPVWSIAAGKYNMPVEDKFIDGMMSMERQPDGSYAVVIKPKDRWEAIRTPARFAGFLCGVYKKDKVAYIPGGIELNIRDLRPVALLNVSAEGGITGYLNDGKLQLFKGGAEVSGEVKNLTIAVLGI